MKIFALCCFLPLLCAPNRADAQSPPTDRTAADAPEIAMPEIATPEGATLVVGDAQYVETAEGRKLRIVLFGLDKRGDELPRDFWSNVGTALYSPAGALLQGRGANSIIETGDIDPDWESVTLELWGREPDAADGLSANIADGREQTELKFELPFPTNSEPAPVDLKRVSPLGTQLSLLSLGFERTAEGGIVKGSFRVQAPIDAPGAVINATNPLIFDGGEQRQQISQGGSSDEKDGVTSFTSRISEVPADGKLRLSFSVVGDIPSKAVAAHRFKVSLRIALPTAATPPDLAGNAAFGVADATVALVPTRAFTNLWSGRLISRNAANPSQVYKLTKARFVQPASTTEFNANPSFEERPRLEGGGWQQTILVSGGALDANKPLVLEGELQASNALFTRFLVSCPVLKPGETRAFSQEIPNETGAQMRLVGARFYENLEQAPGAEPGAAPTRGLMFVFASPPSLAAIEQRYIVSDYRDWARDDAGRPLSGMSSVRWKNHNGLTARQPFQSDAGYFTAYLPAPAPNAKSVEFSATLRELSKSLSKSDFRGVIAPMPAKTAKP